MIEARAYGRSIEDALRYETRREVGLRNPVHGARRLRVSGTNSQISKLYV